jgi:NADH-quinone oxidoreductase subunit J
MLNFLNSYRFYFSFVSIFLFVVVGVLVSSSLLNFFFGFLIIVLSFFVAYSQSIVSSVLALIGLAGVFSLILFGYGASFLAVLYLAVYIGAVAVFFLFVVMMTDLSDESLTKTHYLQRPTIISVLTCLSLSIFLVYLFFINFNFFENFRNLLVWKFNFVNNVVSSTNYFLAFDSNIESVSRSLFKENLAAFLILSIVILVALVGAILLTSSINLVDKHELAFSELEPIDGVWDNLKLNSFGDGKPQDMEIQLARTTLSSVNLNQAKY